MNQSLGPAMALLSRGKLLLASLLGDNSVGSAFGEQSQGRLGRTSSGRKWIKELSSLANVVVGKCARYSGEELVIFARHLH